MKCETLSSSESGEGRRRVEHVRGESGFQSCISEGEKTNMPGSVVGLPSGGVCDPGFEETGVL